MKNRIQTISCGLLCLSSVGLFAGSASWNVDKNGNWKTESNWDPVSGLNTDFPNGKNDVATFPPFKITKPTTISVNGAFEVGSLNFSTEYQYTLTSGQLNISDSISVVGQAEIQTDLVLEKPINIMATGNLVISGNITGVGGITKQGEGKLTLLGMNTYEAASNIQSGIFQAASVNSFSPRSAVTIANTSGVVFDLNNFDNTIPSLCGGGHLGGNINLGTATLTVGDDCNTIYMGAIFGSGGVVKKGSGTLTLSNSDSTYTGMTTVEGGTLRAGKENAFSKYSIVTLANTPGVLLDLDGYSNRIPHLNGGGMFGGNVFLGKGNLILGDDTDFAFAGSISGKGGIKKIGKGTLTFSRIHSYTGLTKVCEGVLILDGFIESPTKILKGATLKGKGTIISNVMNAGTLNPSDMTVIGNCTLEKDSCFEIGVTSTAGSLVTTGTFTIEKGVTLNIVPKGTYTPGTSFEIISAAGGIIGAFDNMPHPEKFIIKATSQNIIIEMK